MNNPNALIAIAQVSQNPQNPFAIFCEYIKYCIFVNTAEVMTINELKDSIAKEFGLYMPHNVLLKCLTYVQEDKTVSIDNHRIKRTGEFDTEEFDRVRKEYREIELALIHSLIQYASKFNRTWTEEYARELLMKVLDRNGLAFDIFLHGKKHIDGDVCTSIDINAIEQMLPDEEDVEETKSQPLFDDRLFVGKFIDEVLEQDTVKKEYLRKICEGLMLCVGTYQLPTTENDKVSAQINGTDFFFDTKLLLRFVGCAGEAAITATKELVSLIQNAGGNIYYYPQTLEEMERAFDNAIRVLSRGNLPRDDEMRLYAMHIKNSLAIIKAKKASFRGELTSARIYYRPHENFSDKERIRFGFSCDDLQQYMRQELPWEQQVIDNDALAVWETHMRRQGDYGAYCGTSARLPVFVTTNSRLIGIALKYREARMGINTIRGWKHNRLPIITDIRLTCRLWSPAGQGERLSMLYLSANTVAAKRPTKRYLDSIRELAIQLKDNVPEYSGICLSAYFDDEVTDAILEKTKGLEEELNIGSFASSLEELTEWKAKEQEERTREQEERTKEALTQVDEVSEMLKRQTEDIISDAVEKNKEKIKTMSTVLRMTLCWPAVVALCFVVISAVISPITGNMKIWWIVLIPVVLWVAEKVFSSDFVKKRVLKYVFPRIEAWANKYIIDNLGKAELPYKDRIISEIKKQTPVWQECVKTLEDE